MKVVLAIWLITSEKNRAGWQSNAGPRSREMLSLRDIKRNSSKLFTN